MWAKDVIYYTSIMWKLNREEKKNKNYAVVNKLRSRIKFKDTNQPNKQNRQRQPTNQHSCECM